MFMVVCSGPIKSKPNLAHGMLETINALPHILSLFMASLPSVLTVLGITWLYSWPGFCDFSDTDF